LTKIKKIDLFTAKPLTIFPSNKQYIGSSYQLHLVKLHIGNCKDIKVVFPINIPIIYTNTETIRKYVNSENKNLL